VPRRTVSVEDLERKLDYVFTDKALAERR